MITLNYAEFYITNVCNLGCQDCNRFNNFNFTGHQRWADYADIYAEWAKIIDISTISILGGEPTLNPSFLEWVDGISALWPNSNISIVTNGTVLYRWPDLYDRLKQNKNIYIDINTHGHEGRKSVMSILSNWMTGELERSYPLNGIMSSMTNQAQLEIWKQGYNNLPTPIQEECKNLHKFSLTQWQENISNWRVTDSNGVSVLVKLSHTFVSSTAIVDYQTQKIHLHNSDPDQAFNVCMMSSCHHFIKGKLYKCGPVGLLPEFISQFDVEITKEDEQLINSYMPAEISWNKNNIEKFVDELKYSVPQCMFCPEKLIWKSLDHTSKKIKFFKKKPQVDKELI